MTPPDRWLTKDQLAARFGLDSVHGINRNAASGAWPSRKVLGQLRFSPEDVKAIEELLTHPATRRRKQAAPLPTQPRARRTQQSSASAATPSKTGGFADLRPRPLRDRSRPAS